MPLSEARKRKLKRQKIVFYTAFYIVIALAVFLLFLGVRGLVRLFGGEKPVENPAEAVYQTAERLAMGYSYDEAIAQIQAFAGYEENETLTSLLSQIEETKKTLVPANIKEVTHVFSIR